MKNRIFFAALALVMGFATTADAHGYYCNNNRYNNQYRHCNNNARYGFNIRYGNNNGRYYGYNSPVRYNSYYNRPYALYNSYPRPMGIVYQQPYYRPMRGYYGVRPRVNVNIRF